MVSEVGRPSTLGSVVILVCTVLACANHWHEDLSGDAAYLRELSAKCRRAAACLTDKNDVASLRQVVAEYEIMANRIAYPPMPNLQRPSGL